MIRRYFFRSLFVAAFVSMLGACAGEPLGVNDCRYDQDANDVICPSGN